MNPEFRIPITLLCHRMWIVDAKFFVMPYAGNSTPYAIEQIHKKSASSAELFSVFRARMMETLCFSPHIDRN
jgi:hypothetical protein